MQDRQQEILGSLFAQLTDENTGWDETYDPILAIGQLVRGDTEGAAITLARMVLEATIELPPVIGADGKPLHAEPGNIDVTGVRFVEPDTFVGVAYHHRHGDVEISIKA